MLFTDFKKSKYFLRYSQSKLETTIGSLWEAQTNETKKDYFTKSISLPTIFEINTSNFQEMILSIFKKLCYKKFFKCIKIKT